MTTFLLVISLLLNGVAIFSIIILYARQNRLLEVEKTQQHMMKDMEEVISTYLFEMKEENEAFIKRFQQLSVNSVSKENRKGSQLTVNQKKHMAVKDGNVEDGENIEQKWAEKTGTAFKKQAVKAYKTAITNKEENSSVPLKSGEEVSDISEDADQPEKNNELTEMTHDEIYRDLFVNQVKLLQKQGLTSDEIAKKLNRGKTEIELLLKFS